MPMPNLADRWFFVVDNNDVPTHVAVMATFELPEGAPPDYVRRLADDLRSVRTFSPPFNYRLTNPSLRRFAPSFTALADDEVDLDYHFRFSALPTPGGERELGVLVSRLFSRPLDPQRPLWEVHLIEGLDNGRFAWFFKVHHGVMDGVGGMRRLGQLMDTDPESGELRAIWSLPVRSRRQRAKTAPSLQQRFERALGTARDGAVAAASLALTTGQMVSQRVVAAEKDWVVPYSAPSSVLNGRVGQQRRFATQSYDLARLVTVAKGFDVTVNDVFLAICGGGLRSYLGELDQLPTASLTVGIPVSIRDASDEESSNAISVAFASLHTEIADPVERIAAIARGTRRSKEKLRELPTAAGDLYGPLVLSPIAVAQLTGLAGRTLPPFNVPVSNVPGPPDPLYLRGARLEGLWGLSIISHGAALSITAGSMAGRFNVGFTGDRDRLPSLQRLAVYTGEALEELEQALSA
ncbi:WS/DGAT/MGAT family O-acyltransferase [Mycobacterium sp. HM-7]